MTPLYWLDKIKAEDRSSVGNKAWHLACGLQAGLPVISGLVVSAEVLRNLLERAEWLEPLFADFPDSSLHLKPENFGQLMAIAQQIRQTIVACELPTDLAQSIQAASEMQLASAWILRPSLALLPEMSGQLRHTLVTNYKTSALFESQVCLPSTTALSQGLKQLWSQLFSGRSLFYWQRAGIHLQGLRMAVLVQPVYNAIASGTAHIRDQQVVIESTLGLGLGLSRGEVEPDWYQVDLQTAALQSFQRGSQTVIYDLDSHQLPSLTARYLQPQVDGNSLTNQQLECLVQYLQQISHQFGPAVEIEWLLAGKSDAPKIYISQINPYLPASRLKAFAARAASLQHLSLPPASADPPWPLTGMPVSPGQAIAPVTLISWTETTLNALQPGTILVGETIPTEWLPFLQKAAAIVTEKGSMTCHSAIIARELSIPAVMGVAGAMQHLRGAGQIVVDGDRGLVYPKIHGESVPLPLTKSAVSQRLLERPKNKTQLMVNLSQLESLNNLSDLPLDGVGLLRAEFLALSILDVQHPDYWIQTGRGPELTTRLTQQISPFVKAMAPRPVFYRCMDIRSHDFQRLLGSPPVEVNPVLGKRGTLRYQWRPDLLRIQLAALAQLQRSGYTNLRLLLPFVRSVEEFQACLPLIRQAGLFESPDFEVWIMAEVPSVLFLLPEFVQAGVQGISIGTNDLTQLLLGIDRDQADLAVGYNESHLSVQRAIAQLVQTAKALGIPCAICGQAPVRYPSMIQSLIEWGIQSISVEPDAVETTFQAIAQAEAQVFNLSLPNQGDS